MASDSPNRSPKPGVSSVAANDGDDETERRRVVKKRKLDPPPTPPPPPRQKLRDVVRALSAKWRVQKRRLIDAGTPIEDHKAALIKLRMANVTGEGGGTITGFERNSVVQKRWVGWDGSEVGAIRPLAYFALQGDLPMMRWLYVHGASTTDDDVVYWFPMLAAVFANTNNHVDLCQWLYSHGGQDDIARTYHLSDGAYCSPFAVAFYGGSFHSQSKRDVARWLILRGALCDSDESPLGVGQVDITRLRTGLSYCPTTHNERVYLLEWVQETLESRGAFDTFLLGTAKSIGRRHELRMLSGNREVLERILHFSGVVWGKEARILRQLTSMLPRVDKEIRLRR